MSRTNGSICSMAAAGGLMTTSTPSPSWLSSKSVTRAATSMRASSVKESPVISQSIQTIRSLVARFDGVAGLAGLVTWLTLRRGPTAMPGNPQAPYGRRLQ